MKFDRYVSNLCFKANIKLSVLTRMNKYLDLQKRRLLVKAFFESRFKYCSLAWMFYSRQLNKKINRLHERALRLIYDYNDTFEKLLERDRSCTVYENNMEQLAIEMLKVKHGLVSKFFESMFVINNMSTKLHSKPDFCVSKINTEYFGKNSLKPDSHLPKRFALFASLKAL